MSKRDRRAALIEEPVSAPRISLIAWTGGLGGAETFTAELAIALRRVGAAASVTFVASPEPLRTHLQSEDVAVRALGLGRGRDVLLHPTDLARSVSEQGDFAILVSSGYLGGTLRLAGYRGRIIAVEHGAILQRWRLPRRTKLIRAIDRASGIWACDVEVAVSDFVLEHLRARRHSRRLVRIYNGVDVARFRPGDRQPAEPFVIGCTARLVPEKGVDDLIRAISQPELRESVALRIAGDGPDRCRLERIADALGVADAIEFLGTVEDVASFWRGCDLAAVPSREHIESFCLAAVEPMACAIPVIATRNGALPEIVTDGQTGTLTQPGDPSELARGIARYRNDVGLRRRQGEQARADVELRFDLAHTAASYLELCRELNLEGPDTQ